MKSRLDFFYGREFDDNWGLPDPTGQSDQVFEQVIQEIEKRIRKLRNLQNRCSGTEEDSIN